MTQPNSSTTLIAAPQAQDDPLNHPWDRCITVGRGYDLLRADLQEHLRFLQREIGYRHIRFHASFHDDVGVVHRQEDGSIVYRWTQLDRIYDFLIDAGFDPIVEINPMPAALASGEQTMFWYKMNVTPPRDYGAWQDFLRAWLEHFVERYGRERMRKWYFEVWNEPNLRNQFWTGDRAEYYRLYQSCAEVVKAVDSDFPIGGPSGAGAEWNLDFARHCREHGIPVDFISYHCYPQNEAGTPREEALAKNEPGRFFVEELENAKQVMAENGFGDLPLLITEWNTQSQGPEWKAKWVGNEHVSDLFAGAAVCYLATACDDLVDMLGWWVASDVFEEAGPHFEPYGTGNQYYGLLTVNGLPKAAFHAFAFLNQMRGPRYRIEGLPEGAPRRSALVTDEGSTTRCLAWNCCFPYEESPSDWTPTIELPVPGTHAGCREIRVTRAAVRAGSGSAFEYWKEMGYPPVLTRMEEAALEARSVPAYASEMLPVEDGKVRLSLALEPNAFELIELGGVPAQSGSIKLSKGKSLLDEQLATDKK